MTQDQGALFGDVDGLFAPPMIECTPLALVELVPGDHVAAMRGAAPRCAHCPWDQLPAVDACPGRYGAACTDPRGSVTS